MTYDEMRIRQAWPYEVKIAHAKKVAGEFKEWLQLLRKRDSEKLSICGIHPAGYSSVGFRFGRSGSRDLRTDCS